MLPTNTKEIKSAWLTFKMFKLKKYLIGLAICSICTLCLVYLLTHRKVNEKKEHTTPESYAPAEYEDYDAEYDAEYDAVYDSGNDDYYDDAEMYKIMSQEDVERIDLRMEQRREWAEQACKRLGEDGGKEPNGWEYFINYDYQLIWCNVFKAASTTWFNNFMVLAGTDIWEFEDLTPVNAARYIYHRPTGQELKEAHRDPDSLAFIIVRHPFERLSSAYRDKIQNQILSDTYGELSEKIVKNYRKKTPPKTDKTVLQDSTPTFEEFVRYILAENSKNNTLDMHWIPYSKFCTPCQMHFDIILKLETFEEDQNYLIHRAVLEDLLTTEVLNAGSEKRVENGKETKDLLRQHYSQLTKSQITQLYQLYKYDFDIFNYTMTEYYEMAVKDETHHLHRKI